MDTGLKHSLPIPLAANQRLFHFAGVPQFHRGLSMDFAGFPGRPASPRAPGAAPARLAGIHTSGWWGQLPSGARAKLNPAHGVQRRSRLPGPRSEDHLSLPGYPPPRLGPLRLFRRHLLRAGGAGKLLSGPGRASHEQEVTSVLNSSPSSQLYKTVSLAAVVPPYSSAGPEDPGSSSFPSFGIQGPAGTPVTPRPAPAPGPR